MKQWLLWLELWELVFMRQERLLLMYSSNNSLLPHMTLFTQLMEKTELPYTYPYISVTSHSLSVWSIYVLNVCRFSSLTRNLRNIRWTVDSTVAIGVNVSFFFFLGWQVALPMTQHFFLILIRAFLKLVDVREEKAEDSARWRQMSCCGDLWREQPKGERRRRQHLTFYLICLWLKGYMFDFSLTVVVFLHHSPSVFSFFRIHFLTSQSPLWSDLNLSMMRYSVPGFHLSPAFQCH